MANILRTLLGFFLITFVFSGTAAQAFDPHSDVIRTRRFSDIPALVSSSDVIGVCQVGAIVTSFPTPHAAGRGKLVNTVQRVRLERLFKGRAGAVNVLLTGVEPLPVPPSPLNDIYTGPLAEGRYICFLKKLPNTPYYSLNGGWAGVYPIVNGRTVALASIGIPRLGGLTTEAFYRALQPYL